MGKLSRVSTLVSTNWLKEQLFTKTRKNGPIRVLDTSWTKPEVNFYEKFYKKSHIATAAYFDINQCVKSTKHIPYNLPELNCFIDYVQSLGISSDTHVVTYDRFTLASSFRTWWLFRLFGHSNISMLDGGLQKWLNDGYEVTAEEPKYEKTNYQLKLNYDLLRDYNTMMKNVKTKTEQVCDARNWDEFSGQKPLGKPDDLKHGHIPGAKNIPFHSLFNKDKTFKSENELKSIFDKANVDLNKPLVATCLTGIMACGISAAAHVLGKEIVPVYYGAWTEWAQRADDNMVAVVKSDK